MDYNTLIAVKAELHITEKLPNNKLKAIVNSEDSTELDKAAANLALTWRKLGAA